MGYEINTDYRFDPMAFSVCSYGGAHLSNEIMGSEDHTRLRFGRLHHAIDIGASNRLTRTNRAAFARAAEDDLVVSALTLNPSEQ